MSCQVIDVQYQQSALIRGGLEIPIQVTVDMGIGEGNLQALKKS